MIEKLDDKDEFTPTLMEECLLMMPVLCASCRCIHYVREGTDDYLDLRARGCRV